MTSPKAGSMAVRKRSPGPRRGKVSRAAILEAGIVVFGRHGFDQATTRVIAKRAKVNLGLLQYYFGSKKNLYLACAEYIATQVEANVFELSSWAESKLAPESAPLVVHVTALNGLWSLASERIIGFGKPNSWLQFVNHEQISPGLAFDILYERIVKRLIGIFAAHIGRVLRLPADSEEVILQTIAFLGPLFIFQRAQSLVFKALSWPDLEGQRLQQAKAVLFRQSFYGLHSPTGRDKTKNKTK
jgi:TetR/AcrR family transcriptional regulator, regulator of cefoperazone and chloramphenicol sensitivity